MKQLIIYQFLYCPCVHESEFTTVSLHRTLKGAKKALKAHKAKKLKEFNKHLKGSEKPFPGMEFGRHEDWDISEIEIQD